MADRFVLGGIIYALGGLRPAGFREGVRLRETNLGDFIAEAFRWTASQELKREIDVGLINGGGIRESIATGDITLGSIKAVLPFSSDLYVIYVTGAQLHEALEAACQAIGKKKGIAAFPQVSGVNFTIDASVPYQEGPQYPDSTYPSPVAVGARVKISDVGGRDFEANATYSVATTGFCAAGEMRTTCLSRPRSRSLPPPLRLTTTRSQATWSRHATTPSPTSTPNRKVALP